MQRHYIYAPKSGSRVLSAHPTPQVAVISHLNNSTTVVGDAVDVRWSAADPGPSYCRMDAGRLAVEIAEARGGVAYDDQGTVGVIVPQHHVPETVGLGQHLLGLDPHWRHLWRQAAARLNGDRHLPSLSYALADMPPARDVDIQSGWRHTVDGPVPAIWVAACDPDHIDHVCVTDRGRVLIAAIDPGVRIQSPTWSRPETTDTSLPEWAGWVHVTDRHIDPVPSL